MRSVAAHGLASGFSRPGLCRFRTERARSEAPAWDLADAVCQELLVERDDQGNIDDRILWQASLGPGITTRRVAAPAGLRAW